MHYITYCKDCEAITGHEATLRTLTCKKCGKITKAPVLRWGAGIALIAGLTITSIWIVANGILLFLSML